MGIFSKLALSAIFLIFLIINTILLYLPNLYLKRSNIYILIFNGLGIGDALSFTSAVYYLHKNHNTKFRIISPFPEAFEHLYGVMKNKRTKETLLENIACYFLECSNHSNIVSCYGGNIYFKRFSPIYEDEYKYYGNILRSNKMYLRDVFLQPRKDFLNKIEHFDRKPIITFTKEELERFVVKYSHLLKGGYSVINSGTSCVIKSKTLSVSKMNFIVNETANEIQWVQVGTKEDNKLRQIHDDLRGRTSLREMFFLISRSDLVLTNEGLITHVSAAFNIPCVTIYTGYHYPEISSYSNIIPVTPDSLPDCAYCFLETCPYSEEGTSAKCSEQINTSVIINAIRSLRPRVC